MARLGVALLPLLLVGGLALAACAGGGDSEETTARVVERLLRLGQDPNADIHAYVKELPEGLPGGLPRYPDSKLIASFVIQSADQDSFFVIYDSADAPDEVLHYFEEALEEDPWQVEGSTSSDELVALQFSKVDDASFSGGVAINSSTEDGRSSILLTVQALLGEKREREEEPFALGESKGLPSMFPAEVPIYPGATVTDTAWLRSPGNLDFAVTFLTRDPQDAVIDFYRKEFTNLGWEVLDEGGSGFGLAISFSDADDTVSGSVVADLFPDDDRYTRVGLQVKVSSGGTAGN